MLTVRSRPVQFGRLAFTPLDAAAIGAVAVVLTGWARGSVDAQALSERGGTSTFLLLVPALIVFAAAVVAARLLVPALRGIGRLGRRGPIALRLAAASLARNPGHAAIASTFLVASLGLALFAVSYRSTLLTGQRDEARYAVPASFVLSEDFDQLVPVLHGARLSRYPTTPMQALRLTGQRPVRRRRSRSSACRPARSRESTAGAATSHGVRSRRSRRRRRPRGRRACARRHSRAGRRFSLPVSATGDDIGVRAIFRSPLGDFQAVGIGHTNGARTVTLRGRIPFDDATLAQLAVRRVEQRPHHGERRHRHPAVGEGHPLVRAAPRRRHASCRTRSRAGPGPAASAAPRPGSASS